MVTEGNVDFKVSVICSPTSDAYSGCFASICKLCDVRSHVLSYTSRTTNCLRQSYGHFTSAYYSV